jgi:DNA-directed RNA polymerase subunit RPC12/RpoP
MPKPPRPEAKYFVKKDLRKKQKIADTIRDEAAKEGKKKQKELHWHRCGFCGSEMDSVSYKGHNILRCSYCESSLLAGGALQALCGPERRWVESILDIFKF